MYRVMFILALAAGAQASPFLDGVINLYSGGSSADTRGNSYLVNEVDGTAFVGLWSDDDGACSEFGIGPSSCMMGTRFNVDRGYAPGLPEIHDVFIYGSMQFDFAAFSLPTDGRTRFRIGVPVAYVFELGAWRGDPFGQSESLGGLSGSGQGSAWFDFFLFQGSYYFDHVNVDLTDLTGATFLSAAPPEAHTPEPGTLLLAGAGLAMIGAWRRRFHGRSSWRTRRSP